VESSGQSRCQPPGNCRLPSGQAVINITILTPAFGDDSTGAGTYYSAIAGDLSALGHEVVIISHRSASGRQDESVSVIGRLPNLPQLGSGRLEKLVALLALTVGLWRTRRYLQRNDADVLIVHDSLVRFRLLARQVRLVGVRGKMPVIIDVRAPVKSRRHANFIRDCADAVVSCSESVTLSLKVASIDAVEIPIPMDAIQPNFEQADQLLERSGIARDSKYVFYAGRLKGDKGVVSLAESFLQAPIKPSVKLLLAGVDKLTPVERKRIQNPRILILGPQPRDLVRGLIGRSALVVNISPSEGLPRLCLEAMQMQVPVLLPPNVPEFLRSDPNLVVHSGVSEVELGNLLAEAVEGQFHANYDTSPHCLSEVILRLIDVIDAITSGSRGGTSTV